MPPGDLVHRVRSLFVQEEWHGILELVPKSRNHPSDLDYYRGMALARLERYDEAKQSFYTGRLKAPTDKRFPLELAGIAFKQGHPDAARSLLHRTLQLDRRDTYANDFLATLYFLSDNLEAALKYWNRIGKPRVEEIRMEPQPRLSPVLLDRAFVFSPATLLSLEDFRSTRGRIDTLELFSRHRLELSPRQDRNFDLVFRSFERSGSKHENLFRILRGIPYQTVYPEFFNLRSSALNSVSLLRWDAQKRRFFTSLSGPFRADPRWRFRLHLDGRSETWDWSGNLPALMPGTDLRLQKLEAGAEIASKTNGRWGWVTGVRLSHRKFRNFPSTQPGATPVFAQGVSLMSQGRIDREVLAMPERRLTIGSFATVQVAKVFVRPRNVYSTLQSGLEWRWYPRLQGDDNVITGRLRAGKTLGTSPWDELFNLGLDRDHDLGMRGHRGTLDGKKGSGPLGRDYVVMNWELEKEVYRNELWGIRLGPFLDTGRTYGRVTNARFRKWLWDAGIQAKIRILGSPTIAVSYGKDLRSGRNVFFATASR